MSVNLSIKNAPDDVVTALRQKARRNHRSLQGELLAIITQAASDSDQLSAAEILQKIRAIGLRHPSESAAIVREVRDSRYGDEGL